MPDSDKNSSINAILGAGFGATGQRCMALTVIIMVGEASNWINEIKEKASNLKISDGMTDPDIGPLISR